MDTQNYHESHDHHPREADYPSESVQPHVDELANEHGDDSVNNSQCIVSSEHTTQGEGDTAKNESKPAPASKRQKYLERIAELKAEQKSIQKKIEAEARREKQETLKAQAKIYADWERKVRAMLPSLYEAHLTPEALADYFNQLIASSNQLTLHGDEA